MIRRLVPHPILAGLLLVLWLVMQQSLSPGNILLGVLIAIGVSLAARPVLVEKVTVRRPLKVLQLLVVTGLDIIRSNIEVLVILFQPRLAPKSHFVEIELELTDNFALAIFACIITATPGSAWLQYSRQRSCVLIHVFNVDDAEAWARTTKARYEPLLMEIFE
ncbi:Na+/H+ antiporter subunit E [Devosia sp.]|uniref:Na+/H+ antiporter subunit E n=1 Tax=Devosia sp. TaxID=1871048 RepID=UPI002AFFA1D9|nr:Na+/H+ antiporter subunit E [Devosia sp.]